MNDSVKSFALCLNNGVHNILEYDNEVTQQEERRLYKQRAPLSQEVPRKLIIQLVIGAWGIGPQRPDYYHCVV